MTLCDIVTLVLAVTSLAVMPLFTVDRGVRQCLDPQTLKARPLTLGAFKCKRVYCLF